jgi:hypothetical protein
VVKENLEFVPGANCRETAWTYYQLQSEFPETSLIQNPRFSSNRAQRPSSRLEDEASRLTAQKSGSSLATGSFLGLGIGRADVAEIRPRQRSKVASVAANRSAAMPQWIKIQRNGLITAR